jgi:hypothetical protein
VIESFERCACGGTSGEDHEPHEEDKLTRTKHWIERSWRSKVGIIFFSCLLILLLLLHYCLLLLLRFFIVRERYILHGRRTIQICQEVVLLFLILTPSHLVTCSAPAVVPQGFSAFHGHSDMVVIMRCRGLHKTCCFSVIVIFILISLWNEVFTRYPPQIQR